jgi:hypothetical protein
MLGMSETADTVPIVYAGTTVYKKPSKGYLLLGKLSFEQKLLHEHRIFKK